MRAYRERKAAGERPPRAVCGVMGTLGGRVRFCNMRSAHTKRTALYPSPPLGSAEIVHPFHPLRGQQFAVLKVRTVSGVEILSLQHNEFGSIAAVPREWTDWAPPGSQACSTDQHLLADAWGLMALAELLTALLSGNFDVDPGIVP